MVVDTTVGKKERKWLLLLWKIDLASCLVVLASSSPWWILWSPCCHYDCWRNESWCFSMHHGGLSWCVTMMLLAQIMISILSEKDDETKRIRNNIGVFLPPFQPSYFLNTASLSFECTYWRNWYSHNLQPECAFRKNDHGFSSVHGYLSRR